MLRHSATQVIHQISVKGFSFSYNTDFLKISTLIYYTPVFQCTSYSWPSLTNQLFTVPHCYAVALCFMSKEMVIRTTRNSMGRKNQKVYFPNFHRPTLAVINSLRLDKLERVCWPNQHSRSLIVHGNTKTNKPKNPPVWNSFNQNTPSTWELFLTLCLA